MARLLLCCCRPGFSGNGSCDKFNAKLFVAENEQWLFLLLMRCNYRPAAANFAMNNRESFSLTDEDEESLKTLARLWTLVSNPMLDTTSDSLKPIDSSRDIWSIILPTLSQGRDLSPTVC